MIPVIAGFVGLAMRPRRGDVLRACAIELPAKAQAWDAAVDERSRYSG